MPEELLYPPGRQTRLTARRLDAVRGFVFTSGSKWLADRGLLERHRALLPRAVQERVAAYTASEWVPLEDALALYAACDALRLSTEEQLDLGRSVSRANNGLVMTTIAKLAGGMGVSPWVALRNIDRVWQRNNRGGAVAVYKLGERAARLEFWQVPLAVSPFFVTSMRGAVAVGLEGFSKRVAVTEAPELLTPDSFALRLAW